MDAASQPTSIRLSAITSNHQVVQNHLARLQVAANAIAEKLCQPEFRFT
jgi:hypothetical protein